MIRRSYLLFLVAAAAAFIFTLSPASGAWGARWSSGSAIGKGTVTGLQSAHGSVSISSVVAHPGTQFCTKKKKGHDDDHGYHADGGSSSGHDGDDCNDHDADHDSHGYSVMTVPPSNTITGIVFCQNQNYPYQIEAGPVVNLNANLNGSQTLTPGQINHGTANFKVEDSADLTTLNSQFNAQSICPTSSGGGGYGDSSTKNSYGKVTGQWGHSMTPSWKLIDFVPQKFSSSLVASDGSHVLTQAIYDCTLPGDIHTLHYKEVRFYNCTVRFNQ